MGYFTGYPKCVFCILGNEFCERFSFYGMKAILVIYLTRALRYPDSTATAIYHSFNFICYMTPILGAIIADGFLGKFKTILYISVLYGIGNILMAVASVPFGGDYSRWPTFVALLLIGIGTGGIKPCVAAFGGDQFTDDQTRQKESYFSLFYMAINIGSLMSMIITPILRSQVYCFDDNCYALAFGVPAVLMIVAIIVFVLGSKYYIQTPTPPNNVIVDLAKSTGVALSGKMCGSEKREHWLDHADSKFDEEFLNDVKAVYRVAWLFIPLPVFWALFDQLGSRWTLQAGQLDGDFGSFVLEPDLMQVMNPIMVVTCVPLVESLLFPCMNKLNIPNRPLHRLAAGMFLAGMAFVLAGFLQIGIKDNAPSAMGLGQTQYKFINTAPCEVSVTTAADGEIASLPFSQSTEYLFQDSLVDGHFNIEFTATPAACNGAPMKTETLSFEEEKSWTVLLYIDNSNNIQFKKIEQDVTTRTDKGESTSRVINALDKDIDVHLMVTEGQESKPRTLTEIRSLNVSQQERLLFADFQVLLMSYGTESFGEEGQDIGIINSKNGAVYSVVVQKDEAGQFIAVVHEDVGPNNVNILWQIPQYIIMTLGEVFFSVTGLSFSYSQSPQSMRSVMQALWLFEIALGNLLVVIITEIQAAVQEGDDHSSGAVGDVAAYFIYGVLMLVMFLIFIFMSLSYKYVPGSVKGFGDEEKGDEKEKAEKGEISGHENGAYEDLSAIQKKPISVGDVVEEDSHLNTAL